MALIPGKKVNLGGKEWVIPPLSLGQLRNGVLERIKQSDELIRGADGDASKFYEALLIRAEVMHKALERNYPDLTVEKVIDMLDLQNWPEVWNLTMGGSGFDLGEAVKEVETESTPSTSDLSTENSAAPTAGQ